MEKNFKFLSMLRNVISFKTSIRDIGRCKKELRDLKYDITEGMSITDINSLIDSKLSNIDFLTNELKKRAVTSNSRFNDYVRSNSSQKSVNGITITDHAIVRYLERGMGIDIEELMNDLLNSAHITPERLQNRNPHTAMWFSLPTKGVKVIAYGKNIVTVVPDE